MIFATGTPDFRLRDWRMATEETAPSLQTVGKGAPRTEQGTTKPWLSCSVYAIPPLCSLRPWIHGRQRSGAENTSTNNYSKGLSHGWVLSEMMKLGPEVGNRVGIRVLILKRVSHYPANSLLFLGSPNGDRTRVFPPG